MGREMMSFYFIVVSASRNIVLSPPFFPVPFSLSSRIEKKGDLPIFIGVLPLRPIPRLAAVDVRSFVSVVIGTGNFLWLLFSIFCSGAIMFLWMLFSAVEEETQNGGVCLSRAWWLTLLLLLWIACLMPFGEELRAFRSMETSQSEENTYIGNRIWTFLSFPMYNLIKFVDNMAKNKVLFFTPSMKKQKQRWFHSLTTSLNLKKNTLKATDERIRVGISTTPRRQSMCVVAAV